MLAAALIYRAKETSADSFYDEAGDAVRQSLALSPANFEGLKMEVSVLLGKHEYPAALTEAEALNKKVPDDVMVYGLLTDAYCAVGDYKNAEKAAQWMLNLRPGNLPAFINAAHMRELFGEMDGSYDSLNLAYQSTSPTQSTDRAALVAQMGRERRLAGKNDDAEKLLKQALDILPGYSVATEELASVYIAEKRYPEAIQLLRQRSQVLPTAQNIYSLAVALQLSGNTGEAATQFSSFLEKALPESDRKNNANLDLVFYYADQTHEAAKALSLAEREYTWRHDIYTLDAYGWALHKNGRDQEARKQMDSALAVGTRDPAILTHSAQIHATSLTSTAAR